MYAGTEEMMSLKGTQKKLNDPAKTAERCRRQTGAVLVHAFNTCSSTGSIKQNKVGNGRQITGRHAARLGLALTCVATVGREEDAALHKLVVHCRR